ncbi:MAG: hypothetical protein ABFC96_13175 [Thermoguttaceae bacterium]
MASFYDLSPPRETQAREPNVRRRVILSDAKNPRRAQKNLREAAINRDAEMLFCHPTF